MSGAWTAEEVLAYRQRRVSSGCDVICNTTVDVKHHVYLLYYNFAYGQSFNGGAAMPRVITEFPAAIAAVLVLKLCTSRFMDNSFYEATSVSCVCVCVRVRVCACVRACV